MKRRPRGANYIPEHEREREREREEAKSTKLKSIHYVSPTREASTISPPLGSLVAKFSKFAYYALIL